MGEPLDQQTISYSKRFKEIENPINLNIKIMVLKLLEHNLPITKL